MYTSDSVHVHSRYYNLLNQLIVLTLYHITNTMGMIIKYLLTGFLGGNVTWTVCYVLDNHLQFENHSYKTKYKIKSSINGIKS